MGDPGGRQTNGSVDADVVIVGAGPVGSALAVDLALAGVRTLVLEARGADDRPHPGTNLTNVRSMEHFRRWGATEHLRSANPIGPEISRDVAFPTRGNGYIVAALEGAFDFSQRLPFSSARPHYGPQESIERGTRAKLRELPAAEVRFTSTFQSFDQHDDHVSVVYHDGKGEPHTLRCSYLVGADGSRSHVRRQLGIRMEGRRNIAKGTLWYIRSRAIYEFLAAHVGLTAFHWFVNEDRTGTILVAQDNDGVFQFMDAPLDDDVPADDWELMRERLLRTLGADLPVEPIEGGEFVIHSLVSPRFSEGRVFLAGESAHLISVFGGFGMNTGIEDAANLGWKLTAAVRGWAGPSLLPSYGAEREPVVRWIAELTEESTKHLAPTWSEPGMEESGATGDALRAKIGERILTEKSQELVSLGAQFGAPYRDSPVVVSDGTQPPPATFGEFTPSASPGVRAPHAWLPDGTSLFDQIGHEGFTLLQLNRQVSADEIKRAAADRGVPLTVVAVEADGLEQLYEANLALVRPDHYVAWRGTEVPDDPGSVLDMARGATSTWPSQDEQSAARAGSA